MNELKTLINVEFQSPTEGFVRHFAKQIYQGVLTAKIMDQFNELTKKSIQQYINDLITERLKSALKKETRNEILTIDDIFKYAELLQKTVTNYDGEKVDKKIVSTEA